MNLDVTLKVPAYIKRGLDNKIYERVGGVIREVGSKKVVTWLRDAPGLTNSSVLSTVNSAASTLNAALSTVSAVTGVLNLAVSTMGFALVLNRLKGIGQKLEQAQDVLQAIDYKIDLSFYANFQAALDLAMNTFTMANPESRNMSAMQAINRFLEAEHHYTKLADREIGNGSQVADEYLSTLCLAYITEVRCYLELDELDTARRRLHEAAVALRPRFEQHINTLLTSNPAAYLHPSLREQVGLRQLTEVFQWLNPGVTESDVFDMQRENIFNLAQKPKEWIDSLPQAIHVPKPSAQTNVFNDFAKQSKKFIGAIPAMSKISGSKTGTQEAVTQSPEIEIYSRLPAMIMLMGSMAEDYNRLAMYEYEVETIHQLGMSFQEWQQLAPPSTESANDSGLMYITVSQN
jgi:hypothetical protein